MTKPSEMLLGALVADAACLGTHWIYDTDRIQDIAAYSGGSAAFTPVEPLNYKDVKGYFAHGNRPKGALTHIGEVLRLTLQTINANLHSFDAETYQSAFAAHFGAGGAYQGYIDGPTRAALANITAEISPAGSDDDQTPALARLPAIIVRYHGHADLAQIIESTLNVTHINPIASAYNSFFADLLSRVLNDTALDTALDTAIANADALIQPALLAAIDTPLIDTAEFAGLAGIIGRACNLSNAGPVIVHTLKHATSYVDAVERNILAGGDSAGRSIMIGAIMGRIHGTASPTGIPLDWVLQMDQAANIWADCKKVRHA